MGERKRYRVGRMNLSGTWSVLDTYPERGIINRRVQECKTLRLARAAVKKRNDQFHGVSKRVQAIELAMEIKRRSESEDECNTSDDARDLALLVLQILI